MSVFPNFLKILQIGIARQYRHANPPLVLHNLCKPSKITTPRLIWHSRVTIWSRHGRSTGEESNNRDKIRQRKDSASGYKRLWTNRIHSVVASRLHPRLLNTISGMTKSFRARTSRRAPLSVYLSPYFCTIPFLHVRDREW